jgi:hypothetical protein
MEWVVRRQGTSEIRSLEKEREVRDKVETYDDNQESRGAEIEIHRAECRRREVESNIHLLSGKVDERQRQLRSKS